MEKEYGSKGVRHIVAKGGYSQARIKKSILPSTKKKTENTVNHDDCFE